MPGLDVGLSPGAQSQGLLLVHGGRQGPGDGVWQPPRDPVSASHSPGWGEDEEDEDDVPTPVCPQARGPGGLPGGAAGWRGAGSRYGNHWVRGSVKRRVTPSLTAMSRESGGGGSVGPPTSPLPPTKSCPSKVSVPAGVTAAPPGSPTPPRDAAARTTVASCHCRTASDAPPAHQPANRVVPPPQPPTPRAAASNPPANPRVVFQHPGRVMLDNPYVCQAEALGYPLLIQLAAAVRCLQPITLFLGGGHELSPRCAPGWDGSDGTGGAQPRLGGSSHGLRSKTSLSPVQLLWTRGGLQGCSSPWPWHRASRSAGLPAHLPWPAVPPCLCPADRSGVAVLPCASAAFPPLLPNTARAPPVPVPPLPREGCAQWAAAAPRVIYKL